MTLTLTRRCSGGPQNKVRIHGSDLTLTYFSHRELLAGCLATHKHVPSSTITNNGARRDSRFYVTARQTRVRAMNLTTTIEQLPLLRNKNTYTFPWQRLLKHVPVATAT
jgi:hypothetical protein